MPKTLRENLVWFFTIHSSIQSSVQVWVSVPCVDPAECVGAVSICYCLFQDTVTLSCRAVNQLESRSLKAPKDTEPKAKHFLIGSSHLKPCPLQVHRGNQMMDVLKSSLLNPVLENSPLST